MKTVIQLEIEHTKPLPTKLALTDVIADRTYNLLYANGVEVGVKAKLLLEQPEAKQKWEA